MGKYTNTQNDIFSVFSTPAWKAENLKTFPAEFLASNVGNEYLRVSIITSDTGVNRKSISGILVVEIFTSAGEGPKRTNFIADRLDLYIENKSIGTDFGVTQFKNSTMKLLGIDKDNSALTRASYEIPFNHFGVIN